MIVKLEISEDTTTYWLCVDTEEEIAQFAETAKWHGKSTMSICSWYGKNAKEEYDKFWRIVAEMKKLQKNPP